MDRERYGEINLALRERTEALGYECAGFEVVNENGMDIIRLYLEMPGGIDTTDCENVSRSVSEYLDTIEEELPERYYLEISSPGLERPLFTAEDFKRFAGEDAKIYMKQGGRVVSGKIVSVGEDGGTVSIQSGTEKRDVPLDGIKRAHLIYTPKTGQKKTFKKIPKKK